MYACMYVYASVNIYYDWLEKTYFGCIYTYMYVCIQDMTGLKKHILEQGKTMQRDHAYTHTCMYVRYDWLEKTYFGTG